MLSDYERRILNEIEVELTGASARRRARWLAATRVCCLTAALLSLIAAVWVTASALVSPAVGATLAAGLGINLGWQLLSLSKRHSVRPRQRARLPRDRRPRHP